MFEHSPQILASEEKATTTSEVLTKSGNMSIVSLEYMHITLLMVGAFSSLVRILGECSTSQSPLALFFLKCKLARAH